MKLELTFKLPVCKVGCKKCTYQYADPRGKFGCRLFDLFPKVVDAGEAKDLVKIVIQMLKAKTKG